MRAKIIRNLLADGEPTGILLAEISNWTGKVLVAPRFELDQLSKREEVRRTGVYLLVGPDPDDPSRALAYVGEGDNVLKRLLRHNKNEAKDFWERTVVIVSKDENLTKSHVRYPESRLIKMAQDAHRAKLTNDTAPDPIKLPESDEADMEVFLAEVQMMLPVLGFDFTQPKPTSAGAKPAKESSPIFVLKKVGATARAQEIDGQFIVFAGSTARRKHPASWRSYRKLRERLVADGLITPDPGDADLLVFVEDVAFNSPSAAASVVVGLATNGPKNWKDETTGQRYRDWQDAKLVASGAVAGAADDEEEDDGGDVEP